MLSRVADSIYWMSRFVERAENVARFVDVKLTLMLDAPPGLEHQWEPLVNTTGDHEDFERRYPEPNADAVLRFLTFDARNANSILSCLSSARENARSVRDIIASEMWEQLNTFFLMVRDASGARATLQNPGDFFASVKQASHLFCGITDACMAHNEAWHFCRTGRMLERADKTSRMLDVKYYMLLRSAADVGTPFDELQWAAVLRSTSAFEMYRKQHGRLAPSDIVQFLLLNPGFPRAVRFCVERAQDSLLAITGTPRGTFKNSPQKLIGQLSSDLTYTNADEIIAAGLHEYIDELQIKLNRVGEGMFETFFAMRTPEPTRRRSTRRS